MNVLGLSPSLLGDSVEAGSDSVGVRSGVLVSVVIWGAYREVCVDVWIAVWRGGASVENMVSIITLYREGVHGSAGHDQLS